MVYKKIVINHRPVQPLKMEQMPTKNRLNMSIRVDGLATG